MSNLNQVSYFLQEKPGAYAFIGNGNSASLHNPSYDFNDDNLLALHTVIITKKNKLKIGVLL